MAFPGSKVFSVGWRWRPHPLGPGLGVWGGGWLRCQETESWAPRCPEGPSCVTGLPFHIGEGRAGKSFSEVMGSRANHACAQRSGGGATGPTAGKMSVLILTVVCPQGPNGPQGPTGFPGPKGPPVSTAFSLWGQPRVSQRCWSFPRAPASRQWAWGREASPGALAGGAALGRVDPSVIQTITTVQSALRQGGSAVTTNGHRPSPSKPQRRFLSPSGGQSPDSRGRGPIFPLEASPSPRPPGLVDPHPHLRLHLLLAFSSLSSLSSLSPLLLSHVLCLYPLAPG